MADDSSWLKERHKKPFDFKRREDWGALEKAMYKPFRSATEQFQFRVSSEFFQFDINGQI